MNLTVRSSILRIANTGSIVAPTSISTVIGACLQTTIDTTKPRLAPTSAIHAQTIVGTVLNTNWDRAIRAMEMWVANACSVVTFSIRSITIVGTDFD